jgi:hypothetical protein
LCRAISAELGGAHLLESNEAHAANSLTPFYGSLRNKLENLEDAVKFLDSFDLPN